MIIVRPKVEEKDNNRTPIFIPGRCGKNEILYPGDQADDWVCDCRPAHVYYPADSACHPLYTQAYCPADHYVEIPAGEKLARCTKNNCEDKKKIPFRSNCVFLNRNNDKICPIVQRIKYVVGVNDITLQLDCISSAPLNLTRIPEKRFSDDSIELTADGKVLFLKAVPCALGSKAYLSGRCNITIDSDDRQSSDDHNQSNTN
ncbi:uncharacterized protein LOC129746138 isoform X2 [Uranotaenia lowii]|uniref:uncharacterized protein LOC129746138 isoform X2 n=1 Tax=Uranotaenia lowii TaxID=190385 RepID=UPI00247A374E|nr:uncharacterized protein LOC129746138 isoform X2 [Uranotaenia lowii]